MKLKSIHVRHYKSLDNVSVEFSTPVTVLVGPNAVGKSNLVDCLRFVRDAVVVDLEHAVSARGGIGRLRQISKTKPYAVSIAMELEDTLPERSPLAAHYEFTIQTQTGGNYSVANERAIWSESGAPGAQVAGGQFDRDKDGIIKGIGLREEYQTAPDQLVVGVLQPLPRGLGWPISRFIRNWRYSALYPNQLRELTTPDKDTVLNEDGRNWASVIKALRRTPRGRSALERIYEAMRSVVPSFEDVVVSSVGSYLVPKFRFRGMADEVVEFDPVQLSDGTLRIFGILLALYQTPAPELLVVEEPEQTVHPGVLGVLADAFQEAGEVMQIIVTTHSPQFIDHFSPEQVRVVSSQSGTTKVAKIRKNQMEAVKRRLMSMQEFMLAEGLLAEDA